MRVFLGFLIALSLVLVLSPNASAQYFGRNKVQYDRFKFDILPTQHFDLYFYQETETAAQDAARMADRWYERHSTVFAHDLTARRPLIFYANSADFQQTNVISGSIGQGTGGVTEGLKQRVVMPFTGMYSETDHVLGHELVHSYQYDLALSTPSGIQLQRLPLWLIEGMAEYLSIGSHDPHTAMWVRDALVRDDLPTIDDLSTGRYFPYRFGHAYMAYIGGTYGDGAVPELYKLAGRVGLEEGIPLVTGMTPDSLSQDWIRTIREAYGPLVDNRTSLQDAGRHVLSAEKGTGDVNISPALSPDGRYVAFLSTKDLFSINLYVADARSGDIVQRLRSSTRDAHFDAIRFINSAGTWSPDGRRFAFIAFSKGDNELAIWNVETGKIERRVAVENVPSLAQPAWSPDGESIAFSGMDGGISDLYLIHLESGRVRQLTNDRYGDLQPAWSPDGTTLAFVSDRNPNGTDFSTLQFGHPRLALIDVETGAIEALRPFARGLQHNPQFAPDGRGLFFISDHDGFKDVHHLDLETKETTAITRLQTGASSFTPLSPAMTVAAQSGSMMFSVFSDNSYTVVALDASELSTRIQRLASPVPPDSILSERSALPAMPDPVETDSLAPDTTVQAEAGLLPPWTGGGLVDDALDRPTAGLPTEPYGDIQPYSPRLELDAVAPPSVGVAVGGGFGTQLGGSVGFYFSDMLGEHNLSLSVLANGSFQDIGGQVTYINRAQRLNYGLQLAHIPILSRGGFVSVLSNGALQVTEVEQRIFIDQFSVLGAYPLQSTRRFEVQTGLSRYGFSEDFRIFQESGFGGFVEVSEGSIPTRDPVYLSQSSAAYVVDFSNFGFTSPIQGGRYRLQVGSTLGSANYATVLGDVRRYFRSGLFTFAGRAVHIGNYGASDNDLFSEEYLGYSYSQAYVRGYSFNSFDPDECFLTSAQSTCPVLDRLIGTRVATASAEVRFPFLGTESYGLFSFPYLPTEIAVFADAGVAWTAEDAPALVWDRDTDRRVPVVSTGVSARMNLFGAFILEVFYATPFQRPEKGGFVGLNLLPGW
ncbi:peptidase S9 [Salinibacter sp. 10B]|uniref:basic secretory protein-like protein n=1 Tax=Salinibacter sp. 10B TaxID=1923971 RepID=UPI000CF55D96|nr:basic secretory protein-like protein [Salinibacter sp. 10B]PQJ34371.1 peptidase S9 [Salinibacter sp. 10B]